MQASFVFITRAASMFVWACVLCVLREASTLVEDLKGLVEELEQDQQMSVINVELVDDELARVYANSNKAQVHCSQVQLIVWILNSSMILLSCITQQNYTMEFT